MTEVKKRQRGRPTIDNAKSASERKAIQLARDWAMVLGGESGNALPPTEWPERICLMVLSSGRVESGSVIDKAAWIRLGKLRGYL